MLYILCAAWIVIAVIFSFIYGLRKRSRYDSADHILHLILFPVWFPIVFIFSALAWVIYKDSMNVFLKAARKVLFPCLLLLSLAGQADTLQKKDTTYIIPCIWHCSCDTTVYGGWLIEVRGRYFYKQGYRKNYVGNWQQYAIPIKEDKCRHKSIPKI